MPRRRPVTDLELSLTLTVVHARGRGGDAIEGYAHSDFSGVERTFRRQLRRTTGGAAVAVYHRGELVVDLWGGRRTDDGDPWLADTLAMCFSTTKGVTSTALHILADRGLVDYDAPVREYWPEFAQNGKEATTVRHVMSHAAGLHRLKPLVETADDMLDWDHMVGALAAAKPAYEPGASAGYHALTYGWLVGELIRRVSGQPIGAFIQEEIAGPLTLDGLYMGCPPGERRRVAPLAPIGIPRVGPQALKRAQNEVGRALAQVASAFPLNPKRLLGAIVPRGMEDVLYGHDIMDAEIPSANGFFTARSLARMYALLAGSGEIDGVRLLSPETVEQAGRIQHTRRDRVLMVPMRWRLGYHMVFTTRGVLDGAFGHFGFGGSGAWCHPGHDLAVAMVCNRGTGTPLGDLRLSQLGTAATAAAQGRDPEDLAVAS